MICHFYVIDRGYDDVAKVVPSLEKTIQLIVYFAALVGLVI
jgi:hypothetical protein